MEKSTQLNKHNFVIGYFMIIAPDVVFFVLRVIMAFMLNFNEKVERYYPI